jgi:hypothetical protein
MVAVAVCADDGIYGYSFLPQKPDNRFISPLPHQFFLPFTLKGKTSLFQKGNNLIMQRPGTGINQHVLLRLNDEYFCVGYCQLVNTCYLHGTDPVHLSEKGETSMGLKNLIGLLNFNNILTAFLFNHFPQLIFSWCLLSITPRLGIKKVVCTDTWFYGINNNSKFHQKLL